MLFLVMRKIQVYGRIRLVQRIGFFSKQTTLKSKTHVLVQYPTFKVTMHNNCRCFQSTANHNQRHSVKGYFCPVFFLTVCTCKQFCFFLNSPRQCCTLYLKRDNMRNLNSLKFKAKRPKVKWGWVVPCMQYTSFIKHKNSVLCKCIPISVQQNRKQTS